MATETILNRKALRDFHILERYEAGLLCGVFLVLGLMMLFVGHGHDHAGHLH